MGNLKYFVSLIIIVFSAQSWALNLVDLNRETGERLYDSRSCNDLYMEAMALEKQSFSYQAGSGNKTQVASVVSTVFTPALYFLGYSVYQEYKTEIKSKSTFAEIEDIRFRMAEKRCFTN
jgi:RsiW-degrading membrane proteinase PrsW (M82 family)